MNPLRVCTGRILPPTFGLKESIIWNLATWGRVKAYYIISSNKVVHKSFIVRGRHKFLFLGDGDIEIGPCWTHVEHRSLNYYPYVLSIIIENELKDNGKAYMIVDNNNIPSIHGIKKVGFENTGYILKKDGFKRYRKEQAPFIL